MLKRKSKLKFQAVKTSDSISWVSNIPKSSKQK